jgi:hypothetical protein
VDVQKQCSKSRAAQGINISMQYIEDETGKVIDGYHASTIQQFAQSVWVHIAADGPPTT